MRSGAVFFSYRMVLWLLKRMFSCRPLLEKRAYYIKIIVEKLSMLVPVLGSVDQLGVFRHVDVMKTTC